VNGLRDESLLAEMRRTNSGGLDGRVRAYRFRDRLIQDSKKEAVPEKQKKITDFFTSPEFYSAVI